MTNINENMQEEIDEIKEIQEEYEAVMKEAQEEMADVQSVVGQTQMHLFNIAFATVMIIIGAVLVCQTRGVNLKNGKKIAGWILLILGIITVIAHVVQLVF